MKIARITEGKSNLSGLIDRLKAGSPVLIVDRGRPVARLEPITGSPQEDPDGRLSGLLRDGVVRPRRSNPPQALFSTQPPRMCGGPSGVNALIMERREGR
ncbi:MAG TPA: type II toxin-antitoxin system prevent-host-death family antitoxin [Acetobacteraceae bacterium]|nr:type II toxin-antitoxin system prevent-host-death family antitoxin [Acetobacteraceae bacterium]